MKRLLHRLLRYVGIHIEKHRDPFDDLVRLVPNVRVAIDGGAYQGAVSREFLRRFPAADVHAFEANPDLAGKLAKSLTGPRITLHQKALSNKTGRATFNIPKADFTGSLLRPGAEFGESAEVQVDAVTLDSLGIQPDVIQLDIQGAELAALRGGKGILPGVRAILCQVKFVPRYHGCPLFQVIAGFLGEYDFRLYRIYEIHSAQNGQWQFADALFVRVP